MTFWKKKLPLLKNDYRPPRLPSPGCGECLPPKVIVEHHDRAFVQFWPDTRRCGNVGISTYWDVGATPLYGQWKIRVDIFQKESDA